MDTPLEVFCLPHPTYLRLSVRGTQTGADAQADSPELNPNEYLNDDLKGMVHSGIPARTQKELEQKTHSFMKKIQKRPNYVQNYFRHPKVEYAA